MAANYLIAILAVFGFFFAGMRSSSAALVKDQPLVLKDHKGPLLKGTITVNLIWYGSFTPTQRSITVDFLGSLNALKLTSPSAADWWNTTSHYRGGASNVTVGKQILDEKCSLGKSLKINQISILASWGGNSTGAVNLVLTAADVTVEGFCMSRCGTHGSTRGKSRVAFAWVGNSETQCPGQCAWPFHKPIYGPQTPPLIPPNGDVGVDGMVINIATVLAGAVTNPFNNGYFLAPPGAPLEAVSACTGIFGSDSFPGYPGKLPVDKVTGGSFNVHGVNGRKFLVPAMWDPRKSACSPPV